MTDAGSAPAGAASPKQELPAWVKRALSPGALVATGGGGVAMWIPTHDLDTALGTAALMFLIVGGLRALDPALGSVWAQIGRVPRWVRAIAAVVVPAVYSTNQFGPDAAGREVDRARTALLVSTFVAYVLMRPRPERKQPGS